MEKCLLAGSSHLRLAREIGKYLGLTVHELLTERFPDGEIGVRIEENVRGREAVVVQSIARDPNLYLMEMLVAVDALKRAGAQLVTAVIPYLGYGRQDRRGGQQVAITAKLVADMLQTAGVTRVITMDPHTEQIEGFFDIPVEILTAKNLFVEAARQLLEECVVVTPDIGRAKLARAIASDLGVPIAVVDKQRSNCNGVKAGALLGEIEGKDVLLVDDICSTGETLRCASSLCKQRGAGRIIAAVTHMIHPFEGDHIEQLLVTDTIPQRGIECLHVAELFAGSIYETQSIETVGSF